MDKQKDIFEGNLLTFCWNMLRSDRKREKESNDESRRLYKIVRVS